MAQFTVYRNTSSANKDTVPYLLNVQSDLLDDLETRVVIPLYPASVLKGKSFRTLTPIFEIEGNEYIMLTPQLAGISKKLLGSIVVDLSEKRSEIIAALDLLITGI